MVIQKRLRLGFSLLIAGISIFFFLLFYAIPQSAGAQHFALAYYSDFGDKPSTIVKNMLFSPQKTISILFQKEQLQFIRQLLGPVGYLALLSPFYLLFVSADIVIDLLSNNTQLHQIYYQYTATITPFIFIATIYGIKRLLKIVPQISRANLSAFLVVVILLTAHLYGPLPGAKEPNLDMFTKPLLHAKEIDAYLSRLPKKYSIASSNNLGSHLSQRQQIYTIPLGIDKADIIALLQDTTTSGSDVVQTQLISRLKSDTNYLTFYDLNGFIVFKKIQQSDMIK